MNQALPRTALPEPATSVPAACRREAGAVSTMWVIVIVILWLATAGLWYGATSDFARAGETITQLKQQVAESEQRLEAEVDGRAQLSKLVGYRDESIAGSTTDPTALTQDLESLRTDLGLPEGQGPKTLAAAVAALRGAYQTSQQQLTAAKSDFDKEVAARRAAETATNSVESDFKAQIDSLNKQLADERQRNDSQATADSRRFDDLLSSQQASDAAAKAAQQALAELEVKARRDASLAAAQLKALAEHRTIAEPEKIDGSLLAVGTGAATAYVDLGSRDGLAVGTRFELLRRGKTGELVHRGTVEVRDVQHDMALVALLEKPDLYDPMLPGDLVRSPFFEPGRSLSFYLLGEFPLSLNKEFVSARLKELGQKVDETVDTGTDVLVLGDTPLAEGEDAPPLTDSDEFKLADKLGVRIMRLSDLRDYLSL